MIVEIVGMFMCDNCGSRYDIRDCNTSDGRHYLCTECIEKILEQQENEDE